MKHLRHLALLGAILVTGCGGDDTAAVRTAPAEVTPVPSSDAPVPTPTAEIHASPTPTATTTPDTGGAQAGEEEGDEEGIRVPVAVTVGAEAIEIKPEVVAAFLPLRLRVRNTLDRDVTVVAMFDEGEAPARIEV